LQRYRENELNEVFMKKKSSKIEKEKQVVKWMVELYCRKKEGMSFVIGLCIQKIGMLQVR